MITRVLRQRRREPVSIGPLLWELLGHWNSAGRTSVVARSTGRCAALQQLFELRRSAGVLAGCEAKSLAGELA
jgi:hypothetical protein